MKRPQFGMNRYFLSMMLAAATLFACPSAIFGISLGQVDTFENGTVQGWKPEGFGVLVSNINGGGPTGINDHYLDVFAGGSNIQSNLQTHNDSQWTGNFVAAGVTPISMDLKGVFGARHCRSELQSPKALVAQVRSGTVRTPYSLVPDGMWHHAEFSLDQNDLAAVNSPHPLMVDLANVAEMRLIRSAGPKVIADVQPGEFLVDNITAVPEPSSIANLVAGLAAIMLYRHYRSGNVSK